MNVCGIQKARKNKPSPMANGQTFCKLPKEKAKIPPRNITKNTKKRMMDWTKLFSRSGVVPAMMFPPEIGFCSILNCAELGLVRVGAGTAGDNRNS